MRNFYKLWEQTFINPTLRFAIHVVFWLFYMGFLLKESLIVHFSIYQHTGVLILGGLFVLFLYYPLVYWIIPFFKLKKISRGLLAFWLYYVVALFIRFYYITLLTDYQEQWYYSHDLLIQFYYQEVLSVSIFRDIISNLISFLYILVIPLIIKFLRYSYQFHQQLNEKEQEKTKMELDFLKGQLNPHLFFNTLNNLQSFILHRDRHQALAVIESLSEFMRYTLYETQHEFIAIDKELKLIKDYVNIEKIRHEESVAISCHFKNMLSNHTIPPLCLMPLVENAFKHSSGLLSEDIYIKIEGHISDSSIHLVVSNRFNIENLNNHDPSYGGIGLRTLEKRLNYYYPNSYHIRREVEHDLFHVDLLITLK